MQQVTEWYLAHVIEDMDIESRKVESNFIPNYNEAKALSEFIQIWIA